MEKMDAMKCVGNLSEEMEEIKKLISSDDDTVVYSTSTRGCNTFLTIYCC